MRLIFHYSSSRYKILVGANRSSLFLPFTDSRRSQWTSATRSPRLDCCTAWLSIPQFHSSARSRHVCVTTDNIQLSYHQAPEIQLADNAPFFATMTTNNTTSKPTVAFGTVNDRDRFIIKLSVRKANSANPMVHVKAIHNKVVYSNIEYPRDHVYQSTVHDEVLRNTAHISVTIELNRHCTLPDRIAMNHTFAGLLAFVDKASQVKTLQFRVLKDHRFTLNELLEVLQPAGMWMRNMPGVGVKHFSASADLTNAIGRARRSHNPDDDTVDELYSVVRMAARAAKKLHELGLPAWAEGLEDEMAEIMAGVGLISPGKSAEADFAAQKVKVVLGKVLKGLKEGSNYSEEPIPFAEAMWHFTKAITPPAMEEDRAATDTSSDQE
jgi:hypothetical protein